MRQSLAPSIAAVMPTVRQGGTMKSVFSVQAPDGTLTNTGAPSGNYVPVAGLQNIKCQDAPQSIDRIISEEHKNQYEVESFEERHVLLDRYYPQLSPNTNWGNVAWRATVDSLTYDIVGAESDSQRIMTRVHLRMVTL